MTTNIYDQHRRSFSDVSAYVVTDPELGAVATIAFKHPKDGMGNLYAYIQWFGTRMVRGRATGFGYDKGSAACASAVALMSPVNVGARFPKIDTIAPSTLPRYASFLTELVKDDGRNWQQNLESAGFSVVQAV